MPRGRKPGRPRGSKNAVIKAPTMKANIRRTIIGRSSLKESKIFSALLALPVESRQRIFAAVKVFTE